MKFIEPAVALLALTFTPAAWTQQACGPDRISAESRADTIFVRHEDAGRNCCTLLTLAIRASDFTVDFVEGDAGEPCRCQCCFDLSYDAHGFGAGRYVIRVWGAEGAIFYGQTEVDVVGPGSLPTLGGSERGDCRNVATWPATWGGVRALYR